jgi:hypothetical protein
VRKEERQAAGVVAEVLKLKQQSRRECSYRRLCLVAPTYAVHQGRSNRICTVPGRIARSDRAIIAPARHRTLILIKVPIAADRGEYRQAAGVVAQAVKLKQQSRRA